ncbi:hypothetical protein BB559_002249 [Furculomyces boomerangus]|uniref:Peptidase S1 domain-containing protein n=2 Tax=Harpellales TaxID=61421 RepID=A0A2T9YWS3_9FUNG|nr:hypothetical protein BB559_002249 [Furculomyces boomerangus]PVZ98121.1 hypothetical protein BB558_005882 [Smittium angustum]
MFIQIQYFLVLVYSFYYPIRKTFDGNKNEIEVKDNFGEALFENKYPFLVGLRIYGLRPLINQSYHCAGAIISRGWVVTPAHCLVYGNKRMGKRDVKVGVGNDFLLWQKECTVKKIVFHPQYTLGKEGGLSDGRYDLALIKIARNMDIEDEYTNTIKISLESLEFEKKRVEIDDNFRRKELVGWRSGSDKIEWYANPVAESQKVEILSTKECKTLSNVYVSSNRDIVCSSTRLKRITDNGYVKRRGNTCYTDSGGMLLGKSMDGGEYSLIGMVAFGETSSNGSRVSCLNGKNSFELGATYYTRLSYYTMWVSQVTQTRYGELVDGLEESEVVFEVA